MGYIDKNLMSGEQVVYRSKLHWIIYVAPALFLSSGIYLSFNQNPVLKLLGWGLTPIGAYLLISALIAVFTSEFAVTNKRVILKIGLIKRISAEVLLTKVEGIGVNQGILARMLDYGTIIVSTGNINNPFHQIDKPMEFRRKVQEQVEAKTSMQVQP